jgi:hypothetical protein
MFTATGIGSMPFADPEYALNLVFRHFPEAPFWPQLPRLGVREDMIAQYSEGMPGAIINEDKRKTMIDTSRDLTEELEAFYQDYMDVMGQASKTAAWDRFALSSEFSKGIDAFERALANRPKLPFVKVQTTGPCTFALSCQDAEGLPVYYREELRDVVTKTLALKSRWQIRRFRRYAEDVICFVDEPALSAFGSASYIGVKREDVVEMLREVVSSIQAEGAFAGMHCCGNTDWSIPIDAGVDILNFDAFAYGETIARYGASLRTHFDRGGVVAWGIVPTTEAIRTETVESLAGRLDRMMALVAKKGFDPEGLARQAMITPSCGVGFMEAGDAEQVFSLTSSLSSFLRDRHGWTK